MRTAGERFASPDPLLAGSVVLCGCAFFFSGGDAEAPLVWIGAFALVLAAISAGFVRRSGTSTSAAIFAGALGALALWEGASTAWSISPDASWIYTNRTVVYAAFALAGVLVAGVASRQTLAAAAATLLGAVIGWALLAKCIPALYPDYGRVARLRSPVAYWNELALLADVAVPLGLWLAAPRARRPAVRAAGVLLVFGATLAVLLTYSRFGIALACLGAVVWVVLDRDRVESLAALAVGGGAGAAVFGAALALPGISTDGSSHAARVHDGWVFALVTLATAALVVAGALVLARVESRRPLSPVSRRRMERVAGIAALVVAVVGVAAFVVFAGRIWNDFTNPVSAQISNGVQHLGSASSSNRWRWWQEAWHAFTRHPVGGTGAATFQYTNELLRNNPLGVDEPHNVPLQFLTETGIIGLLLYVIAIGAAGVGIVTARRRAGDAERAAVTALGIGVAAFAAHMVVDKDWNFVATCGPLLLVAGALATAPGRRAAVVRPRRPLLGLSTVVIALAATYSLAAPWLSQRALASAATVSAVRRAHSYDPLSTAALSEWAAFEDGAGNTAHAEQLYRQEVSLEPLNSQTWYDLGAFYAEHHRWRSAYIALSNAWQHDKYGPAGTACGLLDQARHEALGEWSPNCPGGRPASRPRARAA